MISDLVNQIKLAAQRYYEGSPIMSDEAFDLLVTELKEEDPTNELLTQVGWGYVISKKQKYPHKYGLIGSLNKIHNVVELPKNQERFVITPKFDGSTCVAYYEKGQLIQALSRGNGIIGVDRTLKYQAIVEKYKLEIPKDFTGAIRGEIVFSNNNWEKYKQKYPEAKFPRNISTGLFMSDEISEDLSFVDFVAYKIVGEDTCSNSDYLYMLNRLAEYNFPEVKSVCISKSELTNDNCKTFFDSWAKDYPIDGLVFNYGVVHLDDNENIFQDIAYKFQAESKLTTVKNIEWSLSKNNLLIPVLNVEEVVLSGANVNKVTAYNAQYIRNNKIGIGTQVLVQRSGEVIPKVVEVVMPTQTSLPTKCPICGGPTQWDGVHLVCDNSSCPNIQRSKLAEWITIIGCEGIQGVGESVLNDFIEYYNLTTVDDIYTTFRTSYSLDYLTQHQQKLYKQIVDNLLSEITPSKALQAMNIKGIGKELSDRIADIIYDNVSDPNFIKESLLLLSGIGAAVVNTIEMQFDTITRVFGYDNVKPSSRLNTTVSQGVSVVVTGGVSMPRQQFVNYLASYGIKLIENINKADVLICNQPSSSSKYTTAQKRNIPILTEAQFKEKYINE